MNNRYGGVIWTNHAIQRLYERGVAQSDAWYTFQHPDSQLRGAASGSLRYFKDYGEQRIEVIAALNEKKEWVILSCWSKLIGTGQPLFLRQENLLWVLTKRILAKIWGKLNKKNR